MVLRARSFSGFTSLTDVDLIYLSVNESFSIYAEPKVGYYFDNGSNVATLYKDKPLNIDINVGLRLNIK
jgi:hypothetical protein